MYNAVKDYHGNLTTFAVSQRIIHVNNRGEDVVVKINSLLTPDYLEVIFPDGTIATVETNTCYYEPYSLFSQR